MVVLRGERVLLRPGRRENAAKLVRIRNERPRRLHVRLDILHRDDLGAVRCDQ
jgi:hypothetical protein